MMSFTLVRARTNIRLGQELGRGGEGAVFAVEGEQSRAAKIYTLPPDHRKVQKLVIMAETASPALLKIATWPVDLLRDNQGVVRGFLMPRVVTRRDIHELYSPKSRADTFPEADFRFLVHVAANIARVFAVIHEHGHVLGDVNHGNLLVGADGTVMLIDCDSFQIGNSTSVFTCDVGVPLFTAPELHGRTFRGLVRTPNHDRFGLAVLLFHLLYMGRHPFAGRYLGPGDMPIERAVSEYRFAYGTDRAAYNMERPPGTIPLEAMGAAIAQLFMQAFGHASSTGGRPDAPTWVAALEKLKLRLMVCAQAHWHHYPEGLAVCPWCAVESQTGIRLFGQHLPAVGPTGSIDLITLWQAIADVPDPGVDPPLPSEQPWEPPPGVKVRSGGLRIFRKVLSIGLVCAGLSACSVLAKDGGIIMALVSYSLAFTLWPRVSAEKRAAAERAYAEARAAWEGTLARWKREASRDTFVEKLQALAKARTDMTDLPNERRRRFAKLEAEREIRQRQRYLDRFRIDRAKIRGIGVGRSTMLASYGIETAADIEAAKILPIPGFGAMLTSELVRWRQEHEQNFRFNPSEPVNRRDIDALDRELETRRQHLLSLLQQGPAMMLRLSQEINAARPRLIPMLEKAWTVFKIAETRRNARR